MDVALPRDGKGPECAKVTKCVCDANAILIGTSIKNHILDTRVYAVGYLDNHKAALAANNTADNTFSQIYDEGHQFVHLNDIANHSVNREEVKHDDACIVSKNGGKRNRDTTKGWEIVLHCKDRPSSWETLKDINISYPVQIAKYAHQKWISEDPEFLWWVPYIMNNKDSIISTFKSKYWNRTHKFGIPMQNNISESRRLDKENGNNLWWDSICKDMKEFSIAFEGYNNEVMKLKGLQKI